MNYLSDEELMNLIESVEHEDMIQAPPDLIGNVLGIIGDDCIAAGKDNHKNATEDSSDSDSIGHQITYREKVAEYRRYTFRVVLAMAASLTICILSQMADVREHLPYRQDSVTEYKTKQEVIEENKNIYQRIKEAELFRILEKTED